MLYSEVSPTVNPVNAVLQENLLSVHTHAPARDCQAQQVSIAKLLTRLWGEYGISLTVVVVKLVSDVWSNNTRLN